MFRRKDRISVDVVEPMETTALVGAVKHRAVLLLNQLILNLFYAREYGLEIAMVKVVSISALIGPSDYICGTSGKGLMHGLFV